MSAAKRFVNALIMDLEWPGIKKNVEMQYLVIKHRINSFHYRLLPIPKTINSNSSFDQISVLSLKQQSSNARFNG